MSYARLNARLWEREHYAAWPGPGRPARWTPENPAGEGWAAADAAWMMDRLELPGERDVAAAWGWRRTRTAEFLAERLQEQIEDEPREDKRAALAQLRAPKHPGIKSGQNAAKTPSVTRPNSGQPTEEEGREADSEAAKARPISGQNAAKTQPRARVPQPTATASVCVCDDAPAPVDAPPPQVHAAPPPQEPDPPSDDWPALLGGHPKAARIGRLLLENGLLTIASVRRLTPRELSGFVGPAHARVIIDALDLAAMPLDPPKPTPRAGAPPGRRGAATAELAEHHGLTFEPDAVGFPHLVPKSPTPEASHAAARSTTATAEAHRTGGARELSGA